MTDNESSSSGSVQAPSPPSRFRPRPSRAWIKVPKPQPPAPPICQSQVPAGQNTTEDFPLPGAALSDPPKQAARLQQKAPEAGPSRHRDSKNAPDGQANDDPASLQLQSKTSKLPLKSALRLPKAARGDTGFAPVASTSKQPLPPIQPQPATKAPPTVSRYKTPARRLLGPVPDGKWAAATLSRLAADRAEEGLAEDEDQLADDDEDADEDLDQLPASVQTAYATFIPRTASKILQRTASKRSGSNPRRTPRTKAMTGPSVDSDENQQPTHSTRRSTARKRAVESSSQSPSPPPPPTHRFAGAETVNRLTSKAKTRYLRRTATGQRRQLSMEPLSSNETHQERDHAAQDESTDDDDDLYAPAPASGKKRRRKTLDTPVPGSIKRLRTGAPARGAFLQQVKETGFSPLLNPKTPKTAPSRLRSISVIEKSIDRAVLKPKASKTTGNSLQRRVNSLAFCAPEEADAVGAIAEDTPSAR
ncbi:hypothetical protein JCM10908_006782 [Rhodotorula pacifica]|uniref:uncharacterized protein n=1 Tax=Rhodotorula pacifica TaxID=1495444 RepID=UPI003174BBD1